MVAGNSLTAAVRATASDNATVINPPSAAFTALLDQAVDEFNLAPDTWIDIKRLPASITNMKTLIDHIRKIGEEIKNPTEQTRTSGRLRLYKLTVCCIHGLKATLGAVTPATQTISAYIDECLSYSRNHIPVGLSERGKKLWVATFEDGNARTRNVMSLLVHFMHSDLVDQSPAAAAPPAPAAAQPAAAAGSSAPPSPQVTPTKTPSP